MMILGVRRASVILFIGDIAVFSISLYVTLALRHFSIPDAATLSPHIIPFALLFFLWAVVFYGSGLYGKQIILFPNKTPDMLLKTQFVNIVFAAVFFFFVPIFGITPKTILFIYFIVSLALIFLWRLAFFPGLFKHFPRERVAFFASGPEADELFSEVNGNPRYGVEFTSRAQDAVNTTVCVVDTADKEVLKNIQKKDGKQIFIFEDFYEEVFDRIPLSRLGYEWFQKNITVDDSFWYALAKRIVDIAGGLLMGIVTIIVAPFIYVANLIEGPGPLFIRQERFGKNSSRITVYKFRSMQKNIPASGEWTNEGANRITKVGAFLRKTSLDEFPQCVNVLLGELSLVGPRNDTLGLGRRLKEALPYYEARYLVTPGITGWAQINQQYESGNFSPQSVSETKTRLAYDFYYLKHRSLGLDLVIALKTVKRMFFRLSSL